MFRFIGLKKIRYVFLILSAAFMGLGISYFVNTIMNIGINPYTYTTCEKITGMEEYLLSVQKDSSVLLVHNAEIGSGYVEFRLTGDDGKVISQYRLTSDDFVKKEINLGKGNYLCTISRDVLNNKESFRFYFDKRYITQEYLNKDYNTYNSSL